MLTVSELAAIPGFVPDHELGHGGQGLACFGRLNGREVVIKVLDPALFSAIAWKHAQDASTIHHPNVITIETVDATDIGGQIYHYVVMPFVEGETLSQALSAGAMPLGLALSNGADLADGLAAFHSRNRIHRDVKPENVMVPANGAGLVLIDLELVHYDDFPTMTGRWMFTPGHAAPEQSINNQAERRSDLFCFGVLLYEMIAGRHPFAAATSHDQQARINDRDDLPDPLPAVVPRDISDLLRRLLAFDLFDRPSSADEVAAALRGHRQPRRLFGDIATGLRAGQDGTTVAWCKDKGEHLDLVVANSSCRKSGYRFSQLKPGNGRLLIDPNTDIFAAGQAKPQFVGSANAWGWGPSPVGSAILTKTDDAELARSILQWQHDKGADGLITPYLRLTRWNQQPGEDLVRTEEIAIESVAVSRRLWPDVPVFVGIAVSREAFLDPTKRGAILAMLTGLQPKADGVYFVLQEGTIDQDFLTELRKAGEVLGRSGLERILAYAGPELVPLLASGSWDAVVTGPSGTHQHLSFTVRTGGVPRRQWKKTVLVRDLLDDLCDEKLTRVIDHGRQMITCGCDGCASMVGTGALRYDRDLAEGHYISALNREVAQMRRWHPTSRAADLRTKISAAITQAAQIDQIQPVTKRLRESERLDPWMKALL